MQLHAPFVISPRLLPALYIGDAFLSLESVPARGNVHAPVFLLDIGNECHTIDDLQSGAGGFRSAVEAFETLLSFMEACAESRAFTLRTGIKGENCDIFPEPVAQWCADNASALECARADICDADGAALHNLISE